MQPSFHTCGKLVFEMYGPVVFIVYDPAADAFVHGSKPFGDEVTNGRCVLGDDGLIYGLGWTKDKSKLVAYSFDPTTYESRKLGTFGPPNERRRELYAEIRMHGDWIYAAIGAEPWHLAAFNVKTGEGRLLGTTDEASQLSPLDLGDPLFGAGIGLFGGDPQSGIELLEPLDNFFTQCLAGLQHSQPFGHHVLFAQETSPRYHPLNKRSHVAWNARTHLIHLDSFDDVTGRPTWSCRKGPSGTPSIVGYVGRCWQNDLAV